MNQGMEPEVKKFLWKIVYSLCYGLLWLSLNVVMGLYWGFAEIRNGLSLANVLFFIWFILSLAALIYYYYRTWRHERL